MQNHLLQVLSLVAMEPPVTLSAEDVRDEKVKLLRCIPPITLDDVVLGQYGASPSGSQLSYREDVSDAPGVEKDTITPTYACAAIKINNPRWYGTPFILKVMKCKQLNA